ncbi:protein DpdG [Serratia marcescens]|uniref:protein DpdG n=1 Tax=Serratia marcescens TaxID=615 RepID=UPI002FDAAA1C
MSIINNANPGSSLVLIPLFDRIVQNAQAPLSPEAVVARYRPNNLPANDNAWGKIKENLAFWCRLGLWPMEEGRILPQPNETRPLYQRVLQCTIYACKEKGIAEGKECEPLWRVLTCLMNLQQHSLGGKEPLAPNIITEKLQRWLPTETVNSNTEKLVREYGRYLGFLELAPDQNYYTDPTRAIQCFLPQIFGEQKSLSIKAFLANMAEVMPMMDGGEFRVKMQKIMSERNWSAPEGKNISTSTSLALRRLEVSQQITLTTGSDDISSMSLPLPNGTSILVSYVSLRESAQ